MVEGIENGGSRQDPFNTLMGYLKIGQISCFHDEISSLGENDVRVVAFLATLEAIFGRYYNIEELTRHDLDKNQDKIRKTYIQKLTKLSQTI